jgi:hypothetical protein
MWSALMVNELCWLGPMVSREEEDGNDGGGSSHTSNDTLELMQNFGVRFPIGCQTEETGLFIDQKENGIMGLSQDSHTIMAYLIQGHRIDRNVFSLCFADSGGHMVLGGIDESLHLSTPLYTPIKHPVYVP